MPVVIYLRLNPERNYYEPLYNQPCRHQHRVLMDTRAPMRTLLLAIVVVALARIMLATTPARAQDTSAPDPIARQPNEEVSLREFMTTQFDYVLKLMEAQDQEELTRFLAEKEAVAAKFEAQKEAVAIANDAINARLANVNEFRDTLRDQAASFMTKAEADARFLALEGGIRRMETKLSNFESEGDGMVRLWATLGGVVVLLGVIGGFALNFSNRRRVGESERTT